MIRRPPRSTLFPYTDALPICARGARAHRARRRYESPGARAAGGRARGDLARSFAALFRRSRDALARSEEHTSELQSRQYLVCRLLLEKKKKIKHTTKIFTNTF